MNIQSTIIVHVCMSKGHTTRFINTIIWSENTQCQGRNRAFECLCGRGGGAKMEDRIMNLARLRSLICMTV